MNMRKDVGARGRKGERMKWGRKEEKVSEEKGEGGSSPVSQGNVKYTLGDLISLGRTQFFPSIMLKKVLPLPKKLGRIAPKFQIPIITPHQ